MLEKSRVIARMGMTLDIRGYRMGKSGLPGYIL